MLRSQKQSHDVSITEAELERRLLPRRMLSMYYERLSREGARPTRGVSNATSRAESEDSRPNISRTQSTRGRSRERPNVVSSIPRVNERVAAATAGT